jgi:UDP-N-acetylglucosamine 3-dehydrogenase
MTRLARIAIVGCGGIAPTHASRFGDGRRSRLVACCDLVPQKAEQLARQYDAAAYSDLSDMLDAEALDAISICTPPFSHCEIAIAALERGLHVFTEKPLAMSVADGRRMAQAAERAGKALMVAFCHRFHEPIVRAREMIRWGQLGDVLVYHNNFSGCEPEYPGRGGVLMDNGAHALDLVRFLLGEVKTVSAVGGPATAAIEDLGDACLLLGTQAGACVTVNLTFRGATGRALIDIIGADGSVIIDYWRPGMQVFTRESGWQHVQIELPADHRFDREIARFLDCVLDGAAPDPDGWEGVRCLELQEAAFRALRTSTTQVL